MSPSAKQRTNAVPSSYLILVRGENVLLSQRANTGYYDGHFGLISGHVEERETFTEAVIREALEEASIQLEVPDLSVCHFMQRFEDSNAVGFKQRVDVFFRAEKWKNQIVNNEPEKCERLEWFALSQLPVNTIPYIRLALESMRSMRVYSEFGY